MPVDSHTCREHAKRCLRLAVKMTNRKLRREYTDTARKWQHLADDVAAQLQGESDKQVALAYVYARETHIANVLTMDEARRMASNIAKLPGLLKAKG